MKTEVCSKQVRNKVKQMHELGKEKNNFIVFGYPSGHSVGLSGNISYIKPPRLVREATERPTITLKELQSSRA